MNANLVGAYVRVFVRHFRDFQALCVDDFGTCWYVCRYTGKLIPANEAVIVGASIPHIGIRYVMANTVEARAAYKQSSIWFHESEANCNTCANLQRVKRDKSRDGFQYGRCLSRNPSLEASPYFDRMQGDVMHFHPEDPMHMPCYVSRWESTEKENKIG
jgi:hypothetical protein